MTSTNLHPIFSNNWSIRCISAILRWVPDPNKWRTWRNPQKHVRTPRTLVYWCSTSGKVNNAEILVRSVKVLTTALYLQTGFHINGPSWGAPSRGIGWHRWCCRYCIGMYWQSHLLGSSYSIMLPVKRISKPTMEIISAPFLHYPWGTREHPG